LRVDPAIEAQPIEDVQCWRAKRDDVARQRALEDLRGTAGGSATNPMPATIALAHAGLTTERAAALRDVWGEHRPQPAWEPARPGHRGTS
jgi:(2R)-ethylmalonyl-CoA mutase